MDLDTWDGDDVTLSCSCSYLFSSDWVSKLYLLEKGQTSEPFHISVLTTNLMCQLVFKSKNFGASQNEGNSGSGTLETAVLFGLWLERNDFFLMYNHILL